MRIPYEALKSPHGIGYLAGAAVTFLVTGLLATSTLTRYLHDWSVQDAVRAFHQDDNAAAGTLGALRADRPSDPTPRLFLGAWEADRADVDPTRLEAAEKLFDEAWALEPGQAAGVGRLVVALRQASTKTAAARATALGHADDLLRDVDRNAPDVQPLRAALEILRKKPDEARKVLETLPADALPSLPAYAAWHWNRCVARILCKDPRAVDDALVAYQLRQWPDPDPPEPSTDGKPPPPNPRADASRLLTMAIRVSLADPAAQGKADQLVARCQRVETALNERAGRGGAGAPGRYVPLTPEDEAAAWNAVGLGYMKATRAAEAVAAFETAARGQPAEPVYAINLAEAYRLLAQSYPKEKEDERKRALKLCAQAYVDLTEALAQKLPDREATFVATMENACAAAVEAGDMVKARNLYDSHHDLVKDEAKLSRDMGALCDWQGDPEVAVRFYKRAIELGHKDAGAMQRRLRVLEQH